MTVRPALHHLDFLVQWRPESPAVMWRPLQEPEQRWISHR